MFAVLNQLGATVGENVISVAKALETLKLSLWPHEDHRYNAELAIRELARLGKRQGLMATSQRLPEIVQSLRDKGNTNATINRKISFLRRLMVGALKAGYISWLPQAGRLGETANLPQVLSREQTSSLFSLLAQRSPDFAKFAEFLLDTGAHVGEALRLSWTDITHKRVTFWDTDRKRHRSVALTDRAYEAVSVDLR